MMPTTTLNERKIWAIIFRTRVTWQNIEMKLFHMENSLSLSLSKAEKFSHSVFAIECGFNGREYLHSNVVIPFPYIIYEGMTFTYSCATNVIILENRTFIGWDVGILRYFLPTKMKCCSNIREHSWFVCFCPSSPDPFLVPIASLLAYVRA